MSGESQTRYPGSFYHHRVVNSFYDTAGRLDRRSDSLVGLIGQYQYLGNRVASLTYGSGHRMTRLTNDAGSPAANVPTGFDSMGRVIEHRWESGASSNAHGLGTMVMQFTRLMQCGHDGTSSRVPLYDRVGNRLAEYKAHQPARSEVYRYDSASRLADPGYDAATSSSNKSFERGTLISNRSEVNSGASPYEREGWRLDGVNNWNQYGSTTGGKSIGTAIQSTAFNEWNLGGPTGYSGYDNNGNAETYNWVAGASPGVYRWDPWNRLREIEDQYHRTVATYVYDAHNRRLRKVVAHGGVENSSDVRDGTTDYAYQGWRVMWENFTPASMLRAPATGPLTFVYGNYLDEAWDMMETDGVEVLGYFHFLTGVNYSVMGVIGAYSGGAIVEAYEYDPYGRHRVIDPGTDSTYFTSDDTYDELHPGAINNSIRYTGQRFDAESGLMYYKNRYYDPSAGRFVGRDPLGWDEGPNRYGYVKGRPSRSLDPMGLSASSSGSSGSDNSDSSCSSCSSSSSSSPSSGKVPRVAEVMVALGLTTPNMAVASYCYERALSAAQGLKDPKANAIRHCVWLCCMSQNFFPQLDPFNPFFVFPYPNILWPCQVAAMVGNAHEAGEEQAGRGVDSKTDKLNNRVGIQLGSSSNRDCEDLCLKAYNDGDLFDHIVIIKDDGTVEEHIEKSGTGVRITGPPKTSSSW